MSTTVTMPQLGETVTEGTILRWAKKVGENIASDEVLVEISTDKVDTEVPSPASGVVIEILVGEGTTVAVGTALAVIGEAGETPTSQASSEVTVAAPAAEPTPEAAPVRPEPAAEPGPAVTIEVPLGDGMRGVVSPVVRKLAREHEVDLTNVPGTGEGGRITRRDIEQFIDGRTTPQPVEAPAPGPATPSPAAPAPQAVGGDEERPLDRLRVRIGENMTRAKATAAHVWTSVEIDYERLERVRSANKISFKASEGFSLTYLPFIARATVDALREFPVVNSSYYLDEKKAVFHRSVNLGIAIDLDQKGLVVATIRNADGLRLVGLARAIRELAEKARAGKLEPDDIVGSTFTITNPGPFGSFMSAPVINVPNVGILSTDTVVKRPAVITTDDGQDTIAIRHLGYLGFSWDHRAFDGSTAVLFLQRIKNNLQSWDWEQELK